ncbi:MAG: DUF4926 domain-containing protein [Fibromonadaceae bacterium]|nr:DUF4926 domain-containing protein [Fibromonadaceae bacterium]
MIDFPNEGIKESEIGTVVYPYDNPHEAYEVEFVNSDGTTKAMFAILPEHIDKDGIVLTCEESNKRIVYNRFTFREIIKGIIMKYADKSANEADSIITKHSDFLKIETFEESLTVTHEIEYHWAMLWACGEGYWRTGYSYPPPNGYDKWELEYRESQKLAKKSFEFFD